MQRAPSLEPRSRCSAVRETLIYRQVGWIDVAIEATNREKSRVPAKVEHLIEVVKRVFGIQKVRYRGWRRTCTASRSRLHSPTCSW